MTDIVIIGGGETAHLAFEYFTHDSEYNVVAFSLDRDYIKEDDFLGLPVIALDELVENYPPQKYKAFVAVSSTKLNRVRKGLYDRTKSLGYELVSYISSRAFVWRNVEIGENCFILEDNTLQPFTKVGNNVVMWSGNHLGHSSIVGDHCFISSHCVISGYCSIGDFSFIGVNSTVEDNVSISIDSFVGAGALIQKNTIIKGFYQEPQTVLSKINTHRLFRIKEL
ncbi:acetyltransferase [Marinomonas transparens]|uniref:Acetyltransferase n=1 Tax=Marinomonas transparens TaxID=2795388 RepID=A0A934JPN8_9GAMM|nr:acetyltransferase [Marinomonas transparens]MBJ7537809.1 acetyltransferase [Marinomonas transparens]